MTPTGPVNLLMLLLLAQSIPGTKPPDSAKAQIRIDDRGEPECGFRGVLASQKALDGKQVDALLEVQRELLQNGFRFFAKDERSPACFRSTRAYSFIVYPATEVVGVVVIDNGTCHEPNWHGADRQLLYEWAPGVALKIYAGELGATRAAELNRFAVSVDHWKRAT